MNPGVFVYGESNGIGRFSNFENFRAETENQSFLEAITPSGGSGGT